ncbi:MAG TPA: hypothetical protein VIC27_02575 [Ktedonobacterales bacterium]|jgi:hypothetical protein
MSKQVAVERTMTEGLQMMEIAVRYPRLQAALRGAGGGAWMREVSLTLALAAQAHIELDEEALIYSDVRDLMALQRRLRG